MVAIVGNGTSIVADGARRGPWFLANGRAAGHYRATSRCSGPKQREARIARAPGKEVLQDLQYDGAGDGKPREAGANPLDVGHVVAAEADVVAQQRAGSVHARHDLGATRELRLVRRAVGVVFRRRAPISRFEFFCGETVGQTEQAHGAHDLVALGICGFVHGTPYPGPVSAVLCGGIKRLGDHTAPGHPVIVCLSPRAAPARSPSESTKSRHEGSCRRPICCQQLPVELIFTVGGYPKGCFMQKADSWYSGPLNLSCPQCVIAIFILRFFRYFRQNISYGHD